MSPEEWPGVVHELNEERAIKQDGSACQAKTVKMKTVRERRNAPLPYHPPVSRTNNVSQMVLPSPTD